VRSHEPRVHWLLLALLIVSVLVGLLLQGYAAHDLLPAPPGRPSAGAAVTVGDGGPLLLRAAGGGLTARRVPPRTVVLTFDAGPDPRWTPAVLSVLEREHVPATFFVVGGSVLQWPALVRRELADGDEVGSDTLTALAHRPASGWEQDVELSLAQLALAGTVGESSALVRPGWTTTSDALTTSDLGPLRAATAAGYVVVLYDRDSGDIADPGVAQIVAGAEVPAPAGAVVLFHDGGGNRAETVAALPAVIAEYRAHGYRFMTVSQVLGLGPQAALAPVTPARRVQGALFAVAFHLSGLGALLLLWLVVLLAALTLPRAVLLVVFARRHARRARGGRGTSRAGDRASRSGRARTTLPELAAAHHREVHPYRPPVTVLVPAFNEEVGIEATVRSLAGADYPDVEVIVVDDGSTDRTAEVVESLGLAGVRVLRKANAGKAAALNVGLAASDRDVVVMVDGDTVFERDALQRLVAPLAAPGVGAVSGNTKVGNRRRLIGHWQHLEYVSAFNLDRRLYDLLHCMPTVPGAIGAYRRTALDAVGGVSSDTLAEDTDLTMALQRAGWRVVYEEQARAWTEAPASLSALWRQRYRWCYGTLQSVAKHRRALVERGPGKSLGRIGLPYLLFFQVLLPLLAPVIDLYALYGLLFLDPRTTAVSWLAFLVVQTLVTAYALHLDGERLRALWALPLQQFVYRQLMYLVIIQSVVTALTGARLGWHKLQRTGEVAAIADAGPIGAEAPAA
jgi:cellulose synthase/poly-beta-1,6-N-acetylglucosamine synthase-like glycosyltransferase/peptidoglycan/xylan/chitin deacetylase (PgdA/CDA1 family)